MFTNSQRNLNGGGTYRYVQGWNSGVYRNSNAAVASVGGNQIFQFGVINTSNFSGSKTFTSTDSLYLTGVETSATNNSANYQGRYGDSATTYNAGTTNVDIQLRNEAGVVLHSFGSQSFMMVAPHANSGISAFVAAETTPFYAFDVSFDFNNTGGVDVSYKVDQWFVQQYDNSGGVQELFASNYATGSATGINHGLNSLSTLHASMGINIQDNVNVSNTGASFDAFQDINKVPEPSSTLLIGLSGIALTLRRRHS